MEYPIDQLWWPMFSSSPSPLFLPLTPPYTPHSLSDTPLVPPGITSTTIWSPIIVWWVAALPSPYQYKINLSISLYMAPCIPPMLYHTISPIMTHISWPRCMHSLWEPILLLTDQSLIFTLLGRRNTNLIRYNDSVYIYTVRGQKESRETGQE